ncbi:MAG: V-type ATPase subunit [Hydrogenophilales bacterium]|nr:V-type ATPase subunit [Hydrogenophilales bacterium]MBP8901107.1 V-type ATPase subunit [Thiobacillaceae bacterium]
MSAYLNTRVSLYSGRLWQPADFDAVLKTPDEEMAAALSSRGLDQLAAGYSFDSQDNRSLEQRLIAEVLEETKVLIRPLTGAARGFLIYWTGRIEITNVKTLLRGKMTGERPATLINRLTPMGSFGSLDIQDLAHAEDVSELLRRLEAGPYAGIVRHARRAFEDSHDPFILDAALDRGYYEGLAHRAQPLENEAGDSFRRLMGALIDRINLVWLLRYRFNYNLPPAQVYFLLVASRYSLPSSRLRELAALGSPEAILDALPEPLRASLRGAPDIPGIFSRMEIAAAEVAAKVLHSGAPAIARAFAYLILRERDLRAVRAILRGRHLKLPVADIRLAMYRSSEEGNA